MDNAPEILVVILSTTLAIFLVLSIIATVKINQILNHVKHITEKAEKFADGAEAVGEFFQKTAGPAGIAKLIGNIAYSFRSRKSK